MHMLIEATVVLDNAYQALFLVSDQGVIVVDCPPTMGVRLKYAIGNTTDAPVKKFIYSHAHADHVGGAFLFQGPDVDFIGHEETARLLAQVNDTTRPVPRTTFSDKKTVRVGNQTFELAYKGENHQAGNIFIYAPAQKVLMLVDVIFPGWVPFSELAQSSNIPGYIEAHDQVLEYDFEHFIGGHLTRTGVRQDVLEQREYVLDLKQACTDVLNEDLTGNSTGLVAFQAAFQRDPKNVWASFDAYLDTAIQVCVDRFNPKWIGRLAAADVFAFDNAFKMFESLRIDFGVLGFGSVVT